MSSISLASVLRPRLGNQQLVLDDTIQGSIMPILGIHPFQDLCDFLVVEHPVPNGHGLVHP